MPDVPASLAQVTTRWARLTDQSIGEAQNTIQDLLAVIEAAQQVVEAAQALDMKERPNNIVIYEIKGEDLVDLFDALARYHAVVGQIPT